MAPDGSYLQILLPVVLLLLQGFVIDGMKIEEKNGGASGWASSKGPSGSHHPGNASDPHQGSREKAPSSSGSSTSHHRDSSSAPHPGSQGFSKQLPVNYETRMLKLDHSDHWEPLIFRISHKLIHRLTAISDTIICHIVNGIYDSHSKTKKHTRSTSRGTERHESREHIGHPHTLSCYPAKHSILRFPATDSHQERGQHHLGKHDLHHSQNASSHAKNASFHQENPSHPREYHSTHRPLIVPIQPENKTAHQSNVTNHQANSTIRHPVKAIVHTKQVILHRSNATHRLEKASHGRENDTNPNPVKHINFHPENATYPAANNTTPHPTSPPSHRENTPTHRKNLIIPVRNATFHRQNFTFPKSQVSDKRGNDTMVRTPPAGDQGDAPLCDYSKFHSSHSMVLEPNPQCVTSRAHVSEKEKKEILALHNTLRAKVAGGGEPRGDPGPQPQAANMAVLSWNDELSEVAQAWANQCTLGYDGFNKRKICSRNYVVGQNVYYHTGHDHSLNWTEAVRGWYEEVVHLPRTHVHVFRANTSRNIHSYSQVVWARTRELGCGRATLRHTNGNVNVIYICNYGPAGNISGASIYLEGPPASDCSPGAPSDDYPGLCQRG